jgi:RimJ/RimL family protein N-acetyltransferase
MRVERAPIVETERLILRAHRTDDLSDCVALWGDADVTRFIGGAPKPRQDVWFRILRYAGHWALLGNGFWAITDKVSGAFLGEAGFGNFARGIAEIDGLPELGWALMPSAWGKGIAREAVTAVCAWGDAHLSAPITACIIAPANGASIRVAEICGFSPVANITYSGDPTIIFNRSRRLA